MSIDHTLSRRTFLQTAFALSAGLVGTSLPAGIARASSRPRTLRDKVARLFVVSFRGTTLQSEFAKLLDRYPFGGVILYGRNCVSAGQVRTLTRDLQRAARFPLVICTDQEGGSVVRIRSGAPAFPSEQVYGAIGSTSRVYNDATTTAVDLRRLGLTMNLAPVVEVLSNQKSPIGSRSYGYDPDEAARLSVAAIHGYQWHGLAATAKHFVGLGHTSLDSHQALPTVHRTLKQLDRRDFIPFRAAIAAGVSTVLVAHVALPEIDPVYRPASLSPFIIGNVLRRHLGFTGLVMTDSLMMGAVPAGREPSAAEQALAAGADILLLANDKDIAPGVIEAAIDRVTAGILAGRIPESRLDAALHHISALQSRYPGPGR